jgi:hypothetical protein
MMMHNQLLADEPGALHALPFLNSPDGHLPEAQQVHEAVAVCACVRSCVCVCRKV